MLLLRRCETGPIPLTDRINSVPLIIWILSSLILLMIVHPLPLITLFTAVTLQRWPGKLGIRFFTGGSDEDSNSSSGSWLFRPGKKASEVGAGAGAFQSDKLYEAKVEFQSQPNSKTSKKTVRYVPRPSELRELNFWSPTSM